MFFRLGLPAGLLFFTFFILLPHPVFAASWQKVSNLPTTNISSFASIDAGIFAADNQTTFSRQSENGIYQILVDGSAATKTFSNSQFWVNSLISVGNTMYATTFQDTTFGQGGVYKSVDNGASWQLTSLTPTHTKYLAGNSAVLLAASNTTMWRSADSGATWTPVMQFGSFEQFLAISIAGNTAFASSTNALYRSTDGGTNWQAITIPQLTKQFLGQNGNLVLAGGNAQGLMRSTDSGNSWQIINDASYGGEQPVGPFTFAPNGNIYAGGYTMSSGGYNTGTMFSSSDNGATWTKIDAGITHSLSSTQAVQAVLATSNKVFISLLQGDVFVLDTTPPLAPAKTPLILIPGIGGSEFTASSAITHAATDGHGGTFSHNYDAGELLWVNIAQALLPGTDDYFDVLRMNTDGTTPLHNEVTLDGSVVPQAYGNFVKFFTDNGYVLNKDLFLYPYDWRKDVTISAFLLDGRVNQVLQQTGTTKVDIVAHSLGGLIARKYTADASNATKVRKQITLGAPFLGSVNSLKALRYGTCVDYILLNNCMGINKEEIKDVVQNMTSNFELLPDQNYYTIYDNSDRNHPYPFRDDRDIDNNGVTGALNYDQTKTLLTNLQHNTSLFNPSEQFHTVDNTLAQTNGVEIYTIAGSGKCTLGNVREFSKINFLGQAVNKTEESTINGDGTVPLFSASLTDTTKNFNLAGQTKVYYTNQEHSALTSNGSALQLAKAILNGDSTLPTGVSSSAYKASCKQISVLSPVTVDVYDTNGNHTGPTANGGFETNIPGSSYDEINEGKTVVLPEDGQYTIKLKATDNGSFDLKVKDITNDAPTQELVYSDVPITLSSAATLVVDQSQPSPQLQLDSNGDGTTDQNISPTTLAGNTANDTAAPKTSINVSGTQGYGNWYKSSVTVTLQANDEIGGSSVAKTEYSLDGGKTVQLYNQPFVISAEGTTNLKVRSMDNAGNQEVFVTKDILIDKTPPEAIISYNPATQNIEVTASDNQPYQPSLNDAGSTITIQDAAGNTTVLQVSRQNTQKGLKLVVSSIQYNSLSPTILPGDFLTVTGQSSIQRNTKLGQSANLYNEEKVSAQYDPTTNTTSIINKLVNAKRQTETRQGLVLIKMATANGSLSIIY